MDSLRTARKAWAAALIAALTTFVGTVQGRTDLDTMTVMDWVIVVVAAAVAGLTVYQVPNKDPEGLHQEESVQPPEEPWASS